MKATIETAILALAGTAIAFTMSNCISTAHAGPIYDALKVNPGPQVQERAQLIFNDEDVDMAILYTLSQYPEAVRFGLTVAHVKTILAGIAAKETHLGLRKFIIGSSPTRDKGVFQISPGNRKAFGLPQEQLIPEIAVAATILLDNVNRSIKNAKQIKDVIIRKKHVIAQAVMLYNNSKYRSVEALKEIASGDMIKHRGNPKYDTRNYLADAMGDLLLNDQLNFLYTTRNRKHIRELRNTAISAMHGSHVAFMIFVNKKI